MRTMLKTPAKMFKESRK